MAESGTAVVTLVHERVRHPLKARELRVTAVTDLTPRMRRVTVTGDLDDFSSPGPGDHIKLFFPNPDTGEHNAPTMGPDGVVPATGEVFRRDYTPLPRPDGQLDIDIFRHPNDGPAARWAEQVEVGQRLVSSGPRGSRLLPTEAQWFVIGGDETALPAMSRILDAIGPDARATVLVEVTDAEDEGYPLPGNHDVRWLHRGAQPATRSLLEEAVRGLTLPDGPGLLWFSGEADSLRPVRRYLRRELQLDPSWVAVDGYWKRGVAEHDHHAPVDPEDP
ncbi:MAG TPA: siderophore-interacting protein, partial [Actinomycetaceae bacterium]|nr:siderophore-interacting protein [Actinomycetaceae bacterium]